MQQYGFIAKELESFVDIQDINEKFGTPRIEKMKEVTQRLNDEGLRTTRLYPNLAASLKTTIGEPQNIRRAKALVYHLEHIDTPVYEGEQLIGSITGMWPVDYDRTNNYTYEDARKEAIAMLDEYFECRTPSENDRYGHSVKVRKRGGMSFEDGVKMNSSRFGSLMARDHYDANITFPVMQKLIAELTPIYKEKYDFEAWEIGTAIEKHFQYNYGDDTMRLLRENGWNAANHTNLNYKSLVVKGIGGILQEIEGYLAKADTQELREFYTASKIVMEGVSAYINRYADAAKKAADECTDDVRKQELLNMSAVMHKIAYDKPETFTEAIELVWLFQLIGNIFGGSALSFARFDQYMLPFYKHDIENGTITVERVFELLCSLYLKLNEPKMRTVQSLEIGGVKIADGEDACNDLSKICLEVMALLKLPYPNMAARVMPGKTPEWFYAEIVRTMKAGCGQPMILNDQVWVKNLASLGMPVEFARDYYNMGCVEIMIQGRDSIFAGGGCVLFPKVLNDMIKDAAQNGTEYPTFDSLCNALYEKINTMVEQFAVRGRENVLDIRSYNCDPFASALIDGCLETGTDYFKGGCVNSDVCSINAQGLGTIADSLAVLRKYVYEKKEYTLKDIDEMLKKNFVGYETARLKFMNAAPSFGNDDEYVDDLAAKVFDVYSSAVRRQNDRPDKPEKVRYVNNVFSYNSHISWGEGLGATPNGRLAGEPISDCVGPTQGRDGEGSTAFMNSLLRLPSCDVTGAYALNFKISPTLVKDEQGTQALIMLLKTYLENGGPQIQINYQNPKDLLDAQEHPEKHRDLVVRIAGYCEYFVNLDHTLQNEIIKRSMHEIA